jgi:hypothetical protein
MAYDFVSLTDGRKAHIQQFYLDPKAWASLAVKPSLTWSEVVFGSKPAHVPNERGIYAFLVQPNILKVPAFRYLMYIGEAGSKGGTLRERYSSYRKEVKKLRRPLLHRMFRKWDGHIHFAFAAVPDKRIKLKKLEAQLNDTFIPPCVENDFSASVRKQVRAFR